MSSNLAPAASREKPGRPFELSPSLRAVVMVVVSIGGMLVVWHLSSQYIFNPRLVPSPLKTFGEAWSMTLTGELFEHVCVSLQRVLVGYFLGCTIGVIAGGIVGRVGIIRELVDPALELIRPISPVALVPLSILWFGIGEFSRYFIIFYATVIIVFLNTAAGVSTTPRIRIRAARCLGATDRQIFTKIVLPSAVPFILTGMRVALGFSFMGIVAAEMIAASTGMGYLIMQSRLLLQTEKLFVGLLVLGIIGAICDRIFRTLLDRTMRRYMQYHTQV